MTETDEQTETKEKPKTKAEEMHESKCTEKKKIPVVATQQGYYRHRRIEEGERFFLRNECEFSKNWMKLLDAQSIAEDVKRNLAGEEPEDFDDDDDLDLIDDPEEDDPETEKSDPEMADKIRDALTSLDPDDDELWTIEGAPKMVSVEELVGTSEIKRADVDLAYPGFNRDVARELLNS